MYTEAVIAKDHVVVELTNKVTDIIECLKYHLSVRSICIAILLLVSTVCLLVDVVQ